MRYVLATLLLATACTTPTTPVDAPSELKNAPQYQATIDGCTKFYRKYDGFYEAFRGHATLMSPECQNAILKKRSEYLQWDDKKYHDEVEKARQERAAQTTVFIQFYTPEIEYNDLNRYNTIWHVYLELDGKKFEGKAKKARGKPIEFMALYPQYDRFSTPYEITFNVSTADVIRYGSKFVMASTLGEGKWEFPVAGSNATIDGK